MNMENPPIESREKLKVISMERAGSDIVVSLSKDKPDMINHIADIAAAIEHSYADLDGATLLEVDIDPTSGTLTIKNPIIEGVDIPDEIFDAITARVERLNTVF